MAVSRKISGLMEQGSWIRKMFEEGAALKQQFGDENVFDLSLGNPIMEPPPEFFSELKRIVDEPISGLHRYMPNAGFVETRAAVAAQLREETGLDFTANQVVMTAGAGGAMNVIFKTLLDPGDEVIVFAPYFVEYFFYADNHGGTGHAVPPDDAFLPDLDAFESAITDRTRIVLVNSPNNPTGVLYGADVLARIGDIIQRKERETGREIFLVSDEPYRKILFDGLEYSHVFERHVRSIVATSHSKDLALPGERIGFIAVHPDYDEGSELMDGLVFCNRTLGFVNAPAMMQNIVAKLQSVTVDVAQYQDKRDFMYEQLTDIGYEMVKPQGAFYMFPKSPIDDDVEFTAELVKHNVLVVPGRGFGTPGYFRLSYCVTDETLEGSLDGFRQAFERNSA
ncbi:MAG: pyridoxal phosphate-dependent aminotransferase [SAR202 cluster bacterium]|nr:aspartate aminotransferase [Chloroflexota bacterium]MDP6421535.1 pyridoxal phosphate-dependent aminotransferase [SAR202 cluster bacterium]HAL46571.1 pyridoxal phosphate-dependent aminotransferase [Dehalococcoidia bacterium]MDP6664372.1 pyridoxal phosphate-dependent aminotransferase [SAR202 cluster bacterium]MDP6800431.1 pyridoxal phosphate-dependent aminotransferase [SAR202 cluster bacterium]